MIAGFDAGVDMTHSERSQAALRYASANARARAYLLDLLILALLLLTGLTIGETVGIPAPAGPPLIWLSLGVLVAYEPLLVHRWGGTLGHRWMRLRVVDRNGEHLSLWKAVIRTVIK